MKWLTTCTPDGVELAKWGGAYHEREREAIERLYEYECTQMTPAEIVEMKKVVEHLRMNGDKRHPNEQ